MVLFVWVVVLKNFFRWMIFLFLVFVEVVFVLGGGRVVDVVGLVCVESEMVVSRVSGRRVEVWINIGLDEWKISSGCGWELKDGVVREWRS